MSLFMLRGGLWLLIKGALNEIELKYEGGVQYSPAVKYKEKSLLQNVVLRCDAIYFQVHLSIKANKHTTK